MSACQWPLRGQHVPCRALRAIFWGFDAWTGSTSWDLLRYAFLFLIAVRMWGCLRTFVQHGPQHLPKDVQHSTAQHSTAQHSTAQIGCRGCRDCHKVLLCELLDRQRRLPTCLCRQTCASRRFILATMHASLPEMVLF